MELLRKVIGWCWSLLNITMAASMVAMIVLVFINVILRYGFNSGILFSAEVSRYLFVWVTFLGAVLCLKNGTHLELRLIESFLPEKAIFVLRRFVWAVVGFTCVLLVMGSSNQVSMNWYNAMPMSGIPVSVLYLAGVVGGSIMALIALRRFLVPSSEKRHDEDPT